MAVEQQHEQAYLHLRQQLIGRLLAPGTRLKESQWAEEIGVNRGDVRQAFARLYAEGLIVKGNGKGFLVREYSQKDFEEMLETRYLLEKGALELAIDRITEEDIQGLEEIHGHMVSMAENQYERGFDEADLRFHATLVRSAHNDRIVELYEHANVMLSGIGTISQGQVNVREILITTAEQHKQIIEAIKDKDLPRALKFLQIR